MAGTTYSKFFWQDWQGDDALAQCSLMARGLWMALLCVAARSSIPGQVLISGKKPTGAQIKHTCRLHETPEQIEALCQEIIEAKVCDTTREGVMVSRRLAGAVAKRARNAQGGKSSSSLSGRDDSGKFTGRSDAHRVESPATINHQPSTINHQPQKPPSLDEQISKVNRLSKALGFDVTTTRNGHRFLEDMVRLEMDGFDFVLDILATVEDRRAAGKIPPDLGGLAYFRKAIETKKAARALAEAAKAARPPTDWIAALNEFAKAGFWDRNADGPSPCEAGCEAPPHLLEKVRLYWNEHGQHPTHDDCGIDKWRLSQGRFSHPKPFYGDNLVVLHPAKTG